MQIKNVGVLGCGLMGSGIAHVSAQSGYKTFVKEMDKKILDYAIGKIESFLAKDVAKGKITEEVKKIMLSNLIPCTNLEDLKDCDIIIEAVTENIKLKNEMFMALDKITKKETIFASNTSSIPITEMAASTKRPERFVGLHFFNPVPVMKLVEVIRTIQTDQQVFKTAYDFAKSLGKDAIICKDTCGFVVNFLLVPYLLGAIRALEKGIATVEDIDKSMKYGCGHPMGPLTLLDFVGVDTTYHIANIMYDEYKDPLYAPPPLLKRMYLAGYFGKKSGKGFYDYTQGEPKPMNLGI
jgi:3-hydroxybutyryl-CoA dehydrogenase